MEQQNTYDSADTLLKGDQDQFNKQRFVRRVYINFDRDTVYRAIATVEGLEKWFVRSGKFISLENEERKPSETLKKGDHYEWLLEKEGKVLDGVILDARPPELLKFTLANAIVNIELKEYDSKTLIELTQTCKEPNEIEEQHHINCYGMWTFFLNNLRSVMSGGLDLREDDPDTDQLVNR